MSPPAIVGGLFVERDFFGSELLFFYFYQSDKSGLLSHTRFAGV